MSILNELDLNLLVALHALLDEQSVTRAARRLKITQPAMSHKLRRLRASLGDPLFVPAGRGLVPTPRAEEMRAPLSEALEALASVVQQDTFDPLTAKRTFAVGTSDYGEAFVLPTALERMRKEAPGIALTTGPIGHDLGALLENGGLDIAIGGGMPTAPGAKRKLLFKEGFVVLSRPRHRRLRGGITMKNYLQCQHVVVAPRGGPGTFVDAALAKRGQNRQVALRVRSFLTAPFVVAKSELLLTAPEGLAQLMAPLLKLKIHEPPFPLPEVSIHMVWHARAQRDPGHAWLRQTVVKMVQGDNA